MRNSFIEVFVDCVDRACRFPSPVTTSRIREELLRQQPDYLDFIFFSANNGELYLYSTNDTINETPIYALSLFQTKKFKTQVPQLEEQIANLENIADQNQVLKQEIQDKTIQISQLEAQLQTTEDKLNQLQVSNRTENLNIYTEQLNSYKNQIEQLDGQNYEMKWKIKDLEDQISSLMSEKIQYSQKLNIVNTDLNNVRRSYQFLQESQNQINRQSNDQTLVQVRDLEKIKIDLSNMTLEHENLQERIKIYENHNQQFVLENQTLKQQLIDANNLQQLMQEKENEIQDLKLERKKFSIKLEDLEQYMQVQEYQIEDLKLKVNSNNRKLEELEQQNLKQLQEKVTQLKNLKYDKNKTNIKIVELERQSEQSLKQLQEKEIQMNNQNDIKIKELNQQHRKQLQEMETLIQNQKYQIQQFLQQNRNYPPQQQFNNFIPQNQNIEQLTFDKNRLPIEVNSISKRRLKLRKQLQFQNNFQQSLETQIETEGNQIRFSRKDLLQNCEENSRRPTSFRINFRNVETQIYNKIKY